ncbi:MAG: gamma-glutamylcyclotransferase family protein [Burkholderiaceae bacterium]
MTNLPDADECLFSYGTLQRESVQHATFGRLLAGSPDELAGYRIDSLLIRDTGVVSTSGATYHPIAVRTGRPGDLVAGAVLTLTAAELAQADAYEVDDYRRQRVLLQSGRSAWAYVDARQPPD